ncbi:MAG: GNAT family N-acetyltransferase [Deltaproteobacteria bacterium]|nr:GNAT family N-acetyltransferase [Deltaproteobacteria bacterium]
MRFQWIHDIGEFENLSPLWDEAALQAQTNNPFLQSDFICTWWKYFSKNRLLCILAILKDKKIIAGLPLYAQSFTTFYRKLSYMGNVAANYTEPFSLLPCEETIPIIFKALANLPKWDILDLRQVRPHSSLISCFHNSRSNYNVSSTNTHLNWSMNINLGASPNISKKHHRDLRSRRRRVEADLGPLRLVKIEGSQRVASSFDEFMKLSSQTFTRRKKASMFSDVKLSLFFKDYFTQLSSKNKIHALMLYAGNHLLAITYAYNVPQEFGWVLTSFNDDFKHYRPGYLLIEELIGYMKNLNISFYNWYGHEALYKKQWCNETFPLTRIRICKKTLKMNFVSWVCSSIHGNSKTKEVVKSFIKRIIS